MKILQVVHGFLPQFRGGTELYLLGLVRELRRLGHDVEIVTGTTHVADEPKIDRFIHDGFPVHKIVLSGSYLEHWTRSLCPDASALFRDVVKSVRPDIVHIQHWYRLSRDLAEQATRLDVPVVCTLHDLWTSCPRIFRIRDESFCERPLGSENCLSCVPRFPWMDDPMTAREIDLFRDDFVQELALARRIIVPSEAHGELVRSVLPVDEARIHVLPHGTITGLGSESRPPLASAKKAPRENDRRRPIRLGMWGHLFHMKGAHLLLEAMGEIRRKDRFEIHIWGEVIEPAYKERLEELSQGLNVHWHGAYQPPDLAKTPLDVAVIPSLCAESFSFVLDEAFALGLPAIVSDRGALAERIGNAGAVFEAESSKSLSAVLIDLIRRPDQIAAWREAIPELVGMDWHAREMGRIYEKVVREGAPLEGPGNELLERRLGHLARRQRESEALMFGYLGHIKREQGRGDHYEGVVKEMIAKEIRMGAEKARAEDKARDLEAQLRTLREEVRSRSAELKTMDDALKTMDKELKSMDRDLKSMDRELKARESRIEERERLLETLGLEVEWLREVLLLIEDDEPRLPPVHAPIPETSVHVPGLGPMEEVRSMDEALSRGFLKTLRGLREGRRFLTDHLAEKDRVVVRLAEMVEEMRRAFTAILGSEERFDEIEGAEEAVRDVDVPVLGTLGEARRVNLDLAREALTHVAQLRRSLEAAESEVLLLQARSQTESEPDAETETEAESGTETETEAETAAETAEPTPDPAGAEGSPKAAEDV